MWMASKPAPLNFTFTFNHEETPNNATPCPYPTPPGEGCTDRVTFVSAPQPTTFNVGGVDYTLAMSFLDVNGNPVSEFITREGGTINTSGLVGQFILPPVPPAGPALVKATTQPTATIGEAFKYRITVPAAPYSTPLYDVRILDDLTASAADLEYVGVTKVSGSGAWTPTNTGTNTNLIIEDNGAGIDIPAGEQVEIEVTVRLQDTATNVAGLAFTNTASSTYQPTGQRWRVAAAGHRRHERTDDDRRADADVAEIRSDANAPGHAGHVPSERAQRGPRACVRADDHRPLAERRNRRHVQRGPDASDSAGVPGRRRYAGGARAHCGHRLHGRVCRRRPTAR